MKNDLYIIVKNSLQGNTTQQKLEDVKNRIFMNNMIDRWTKEDYEFNEILHQIKSELESELNGGI